MPWPEMPSSHSSQNEVAEDEAEVKITTTEDITVKFS